MSPSSRTSTDQLLGDVEIYPDVNEHPFSTDTVIGDWKRVEKTLLRKLDLRTFFLVFFYIMNHVDRSNVAAARLKGLEEDLHMTGRQFNTLVSIMFIGYVPMQIPSNMFLNRLNKPSAYLSLCIFMWGIFSISTGAATSYRAALISRFFLGLSEAAYYPGVLFILSRWYKRDELGLRMVYLVCGASASKVIGPLTASAILGTMDGKLGYAAWRWLFFIEGSFTCALTALALHMIPDYPSTPASWLTTDEQIVAQKRMVEDVCGVENDSLNSARRSGLAEVLTDWTVWWLAITAISLKIMMSHENFFPTLAATLGYSPTVSLFLCAPPWVLGVTTSFFIVRHSDRTRERFWHTICPILIGIIGFTVATLTMNTAVRYSSLFFMAQSSVSYTIALAWLSNSIPDSPSKRAVALAFVNAFSGLGDIGGSYLWVASWGPSYSKSYQICIFAAVISATMLWVYRIYLIRLNRKAVIDERALGLPAGFRYIA